MSRRKRHETMRALAKAATVVSSPDAYDHVIHELEELGRTVRIMPLKRRRLLQSIHALRALESALKAVLRGNGVHPAHSMGDLLKQLENLPAGNPSRLHSATRLKMHSGLRPYRNKLMHQANFYPAANHELETMLADAETCFSLVVK